MSRTWAFVGGLLIVSAVTYINISTIKVVTNDIQSSLVRQRKRLEAARNASAQRQGLPSDPEPKKGFSVFIPSANTIADRIKKTWNEDIERTVRKVQDTNWEKVVIASVERFNRLRQRIAESEVDPKEEKKSSS
jgi:hypothetical protein